MARVVVGEEEGALGVDEDAGDAAVVGAEKVPAVWWQSRNAQGQVADRVAVGDDHFVAVAPGRFAAVPVAAQVSPCLYRTPSGHCCGSCRYIPYFPVSPAPGYRRREDYRSPRIL